MASGSVNDSLQYFSEHFNLQCGFVKFLFGFVAATRIYFFFNGPMLLLFCEYIF